MKILKINYKVLAGFLLQILAIILLVGQAEYGWINVANTFTGRVIIWGIFVMGSVGSGLLTDMKKGVIIGLVSFCSQSVMVMLFGQIGIMDASVTPSVYSGSGMNFALDGLSGIVSTITVMNDVVDLILRIVPTIVIIGGIVGILLSTDNDEMQAPIIETVVSIVLLAVYYGLGSFIGFL